MSAARIDRMVAAGEFETPEFESTTGTRRESALTVCAMPSQRGDQVLFGVIPEGQLVGRLLGERIIQEIGHGVRKDRSARLPEH